MQTFTVKVLSCCNSLTEAHTFLNNDLKCSKHVVYPKVNISIKRRHEDFVAHDYVQQLMGEKWTQSEVSDDIEDRLTWNTLDSKRQALYFFYCILFLPFHVLFYPFCTILKKKGTNKTDKQNSCLRFLRGLSLHFTYPVNRFISSNVISQIFFIGFLLAVRQALPSANNHYDFLLKAVDIFVMIKCCGFLVQDCPLLFRNIISNFLYSDRLMNTDTFWCSMNVISVLSILASRMVKFAGRFLTPHVSPQDITPWGYSLLGVGVGLAITKFFFYGILFREFGPVSMSIKRLIAVKMCFAKVFNNIFVNKDLLTASWGYIVFLVGFGLGINYIMLHVPEVEDCQPHNVSTLRM